MEMQKLEKSILQRKSCKKAAKDFGRMKGVGIFASSFTAVPVRLGYSSIVN